MDFGDFFRLVQPDDFEIAVAADPGEAFKSFTSQGSEAQSISRA